MRDCKQEDIRLHIELTVSVPVNSAGEAQAEAIDKCLSNNLHDWYVSEDSPYLCGCCDEGFKSYEGAVGHLSVTV